MGKLDTPLSPGERRTLDEAWYNELVDKLGTREAPGPFHLSASSNHTTVHYTGSEVLTPSSVAIKDATDWGVISSDQVVVEWNISGVGHFDGTEGSGTPPSTIRTAGNQVVNWTWGTSGEVPGASGYTYRDWAATPGGSPLPTSVIITGTGKILASTVDGDHVDTTSDLSGLSVSSGHRRYVLEDNQIYTYNGSNWNASAPAWVTHGTAKSHIVVDRAYDPDYLGDVAPRLIAEREALFLDGGSARIVMQDLSQFADDITNVDRTVTVAFDDTTTAGLTILSNETDTDIQSLTADEKTIEVLAEREGVVRITASYEATFSAGGTTTETITKAVRVWLAGRRRLPGTGTPTLPSRVVVTPGNGQTKIELGAPVKVLRIMDTYEAQQVELPVIVPRPQAPKPKNIPGAIIARLGTQPSSGALPSSDSGAIPSRPSSGAIPSRPSSGAIPQEPTTSRPIATAIPNNSAGAMQISQAAELVATYMQDLNDAGARYYEILFRQEQDDDRVNLRSGEMVYGEGMVVRLTAKISDDGINETWRARGYCPTLLLTLDQNLPKPLFDAYVTGACDMVVAKMTFGYGDVNSGDFPRETFTQHLAFDPDAGLAQGSVALPYVEPVTVRDGWYTKVEVAASWTGESTGRVVYDWEPAETIPTGQPSMVLIHKNHDDYTAHLDGNEGFQFYGSLNWTSQSNEVGLLEDLDNAALKGGLISEKTLVTVPIQHYNGAHLVASGHFRARGGTCQRSGTKISSRRVVPNGLPVIQRGSSEAIPLVAAPNSTTLYKNAGGVWMSVLGEWIALSGIGIGANGIGLDDVTVALPDGAGGLLIPTSATREGRNTFSYQLDQDYVTGTIEIKFFFTGGITAAQSLGGLATSSSFDVEGQVLTLRYWGKTFTGADDYLVAMSATPATGDKMTFNLTIDAPAVGA